MENHLNIPTPTEGEPATGECLVLKNDRLFWFLNALDRHNQTPGSSLSQFTDLDTLETAIALRVGQEAGVIDQLADGRAVVSTAGRVWMQGQALHLSPCLFSPLAA